ncbi:MAG: hypothetical protein E6J41_29395, partial [Chloroflexi bacterium]
MLGSGWRGGFSKPDQSPGRVGPQGRRARGGGPGRAARRARAWDTSGVVADRVLPLGKLPAALLGRLLGDLAPLPPEVLVGPGIGEDACAIQVEAGVLVAAGDPITLTGADLGRAAVTVNANDVAVTGVRPRWFLATILLPAGTTEADVMRLFADMRRTLTALGAALVGGHT